VSAALPRPLLWAARACLGAWLVYLLIAPTVGFGWIDSWHDEQRAVQLILLALSTVVGLALLLVGAISVSVLLLAFLGAGVLSAALSLHPAAGLAEVGLFAMLGLTAAVAATVAREDGSVARQVVPLAALILGAAHVSGIAVRVAAAHSVGAQPEVGIFLLGYANPRFASALYVLLMPLVGALAVDGTRRPALRVLAAVVLTGLWAANIGLGTRGVWLAFAIAVPLCALLAGLRATRRLALALGATALLGAGVYVLITLLLSSAAPTGEGLAVAVPDGLQNLTLTHRDALWHAALETWLQHPMLGAGPMHLAMSATFVGAHPHNWVLQLLAEWGALGTVILATWLYRSTRRIQRVAAENGGTPVLLALLAALALGLVDGNLVMPVSQTAFALLLGLALSQALAGPGTKLVTRVLLAGASIAATLHLLQFATATYAQLPAETAEFRKRYPEAWLTPRLWETGTMFLKSDK
jgi:O-antigen ligase